MLKCFRDIITVQRNFLEKFLNKISNFPSWIKEIIYVNLSKEINTDNNLAYIFASYKPILTDKGKCEFDYKKSHFDQNIYNILGYCDAGVSISEIAINTYLSLEEIANYFLLGLEEGFIQLPDNSQIINVAGFLAGKYRTGEYFVQNGTISEKQLDDAILNYEHRTNKKNKKFGQSLIEMGLISQKQLDMILYIKEEAKRRFILDHNEVPKIREDEDYEKIIADLKRENQQLKNRLSEMVNYNEK